MKYVLYIFIYIYIFTGVFISLKLFKHPLGKFIGAVWYGLFWVPILIADAIVGAMNRE